MLSPDTQLDWIERNHLAVLVAQPGFSVLQKIMEIGCEKFRLALDNANTEADILKAHNLRKASVMYYSDIVNRINSEIELHKNSVKVNEVIGDNTEGLFDSDVLEQIADQMPNIGGIDERN